MYVSSEVAELIEKAFSTAKAARFEYVTPEVALYAACQNPVFARAFENCGGNLRELDMDLRIIWRNIWNRGRIPGRSPSFPRAWGM